MNDELNNEFFSHFDSREADKESIASELGNSVSTIVNWRSNGIPKGKRFACRALLNKIKSQKLESLRGTMIMHPSYDQHKRWNEAALSAGMTIEDWAFDGLERMADEYFNQIPDATDEPKEH